MLRHLKTQWYFSCFVNTIYSLSAQLRHSWGFPVMPTAQGPHSHILMTGGGVRQRFIFYTQKNPNFRICLPKKIPTFFSIPKKIPQCFCISKFYYLSSGKLKHANFNFGFGQKQNYKLHLCYFWFELMKNTIPKKIPLLFLRPKKIPASFIDPKKSL